MSPQELAAKVGETIGTSEWVEVSQERINQFADATGDHQFIHINEEAAKMTRRECGSVRWRSGRRSRPPQTSAPITSAAVSTPKRRELSSARWPWRQTTSASGETSAQPFTGRASATSRARMRRITGPP